jgi:UrcA family protein
VEQEITDAYAFRFPYRADHCRDGLSALFAFAAGPVRAQDDGGPAYNNGGPAYNSGGYGYDNGPAYNGYGPNYTGYGPSDYQNGPDDEVIVTGPHRHIERSTIGAPIEDVVMRRPVRFDDLDLRTSWGAHELRERVRVTASAMCRDLEARYPIATSDNTPCYEPAVEDAMYQADAVIRSARGYAN